MVGWMDGWVDGDGLNGWNNILWLVRQEAVKKKFARAHKRWQPWQLLMNVTECTQKYIKKERERKQTHTSTSKLINNILWNNHRCMPAFYAHVCTAFSQATIAILCHIYCQNKYDAPWHNCRLQLYMQTNTLCSPHLISSHSIAFHLTYWFVFAIVTVFFCLFLFLFIYLVILLLLLLLLFIV